MKFYDAHNHLQDDRFGGRQRELLAVCEKAGIARMVVNGACEEDWPQVLQLAREKKKVMPSFGYHPWYLNERTADWLENLEAASSTKFPSAIGEIRTRSLETGPALRRTGGSVSRSTPSCHRTEFAREHSLPSGVGADAGAASAKSASSLRLGAAQLRWTGGNDSCLHQTWRVLQFSRLLFTGTKIEATRETFRQVPADRLLIETDAPDQHLPPGKVLHPLTDLNDNPLNHPANLPAVYDGLAEFLGEATVSLAERVQQNFQKIFVES